MKFQHGDRVVYTCDTEFANGYNDTNYLRRGVVSSRENDQGVNILWDDGEDESWFYDYRFTLEIFYDSPLAQELK